MNDEQRKLMRAKHGMDNPPDPGNPIAKAMLDAERITAGAHGRDNAALFDPTWSPAMRERANTAMHEVLIRIALPDDDPNRIRLNDADDLCDLESVPDDALVVWAVGARLAHVGRPHTRLDRVDWFTSVVQFAQEIDDYRPYTNSDTSIRQHPTDFEMRCTVNIAASCTAPLSRDVSDYRGGTTRLMRVHRGRFVLLFRCCTACEDLAGRIADNNYKTSVIDGRADLPRGAAVPPMP
ncbi:hypothetical protein PJM27_22350 [Mycobacterium kansasii]